jgi:shikimate kinase
MNAMLAPRRLAVVGLRGEGKSRVGQALAAGLGWPFHDADRMAEARSGSTVEEMFREWGETRFRDLEAAILAELAESPPPLVAALGGGVVERAENRACLRSDFFVVWLDVTPEEAARRVGAGRGRPLLEGGNPEQILARLHRRRRPWYEEVANLRLVSEAATRPEDLRERVRDALQSESD